MLKKIVAAFLILVFLTSVVSAISNSESVKKAGYDTGYKKGITYGKSDCSKYGKSSVLRKIPYPVIPEKWPNQWKKQYKFAYENGFLEGYKSSRVACMRR